MKRTTYLLASSAVLAALLIAGCGGGSSTTTTTSGSAAKEESGTSVSNKSSESGAGGSGTIQTAEISGLGNVLVNSEGMTLYLFTVDKGTTSACYEACESAWPPVIAKGKPTAGEGAMSADLGTTKRKNGTMQVTYKGHPLYTFSGDTAAGESNGQEFEGTWFVLNEAGEKVSGKATSEESSGGGGGGY